MALVKSVHQNAASGRVPFTFGGSGNGRVVSKTSWASDELTLNASQKVFKALKACYVSNFAIRSADMDTGATLTWDVGSTINGGEFIAAASGQTANVNVTNVIDPAATPGTALAAGAFIYLSVNAAATTPVAGITEVSFNVVYV